MMLSERTIAFFPKVDPRSPRSKLLDVDRAVSVRAPKNYRLRPCPAATLRSASVNLNRGLRPSLLRSYTRPCIRLHRPSSDKIDSQATRSVRVRQGFLMEYVGCNDTPRGRSYARDTSRDASDSRSQTPRRNFSTRTISSHFDLTIHVEPPFPRRAGEPRDDGIAEHSVPS